MPMGTPKRQAASWEKLWRISFRALEPVQESNWWLQQARRLHCPLQVVRAAAAPPHSNKEMEGVAWVADQLNVIPGRLGLHQ
jgi:hypothetical protein